MEVPLQKLEKPGITSPFVSLPVDMLQAAQLRGEREFPGIPASHSRSRKLGMIFSLPFPFPKVGNAIFHSRSRSQNLGMQLSIPVPVTGNGLSRSGIRAGIEFKRWEKEGF